MRKRTGQNREAGTVPLLCYRTGVDMIPPCKGKGSIVPYGGCQDQPIISHHFLLPTLTTNVVCKSLQGTVLTRSRGLHRLIKSRLSGQCFDSCTVQNNKHSTSCSCSVVFALLSAPRNRESKCGSILTQLTTSVPLSHHKQSLPTSRLGYLHASTLGPVPDRPPPSLSLSHWHCCLYRILPCHSLTRHRTRFSSPSA